MFLQLIISAKSWKASKAKPENESHFFNFRDCLSYEIHHEIIFN